ncbi:hypothetical protein SO802_008425 [Lithocarpus litseifolius]|uniref:F-box domain-containing protein n=1 Tax=Lithocarpus litseifolius TaxID=425828 RepID=A0AAW2DBC1_9ROSI
MSKWADLPHDILIKIIRRLSIYDDFVIFGAVCKSWHSVYLLENPPLSPLPPRCPWLLLAKENEQSIKESRGFFNLIDSKVYNFKLPELVGKKCFGISFGWLLSIGTDFEMNLFHPFSKHLLRLPPQPHFSDSDSEVDDRNLELDPIDYTDIYVYKCVLSRNLWNFVTHEYDCDCKIMVIYSNYHTLAFTRPGNKAWINICFDDIALYKGKFYAIDCHECSTEVRSKDEYKWVSVDGLGDQALFVGGNSLACLSASRLNGWKANSIYFTDDNREFHHSTLNGGGYNMGVFSMEDGSIKQHYQGKEEVENFRQQLLAVKRHAESKRLLIG